MANMWTCGFPQNPQMEPKPTKAPLRTLSMGSHKSGNTPSCSDLIRTYGLVKPSNSYIKFKSQTPCEGSNITIL